MCLLLVLHYYQHLPMNLPWSLIPWSDMKSLALRRKCIKASMQVKICSALKLLLLHRTVAFSCALLWLALIYKTAVFSILNEKSEAEGLCHAKSGTLGKSMLTKLT
jgi:hypothetical protein